MWNMRRMGVVVAAVVALTTAGSSAQAQPRECGLVGSWLGYAGGSLAWSGLHAAGSTTARNGEMVLNFTYVADDLLRVGSLYPDATRLLPGHGVYEQVPSSGTQYKFAWYAYGSGSDAWPLYSVRVTGVAQVAACDNVSIDYVYEVFNGFVPPQDMLPQSSNYQPPVYVTSGSAAEMRLPLAAPPVP